MVTGQTDTASDTFTIRHPDPSITINKPINPDTITGTPNLPAGESELSWQIVDSNGKVVASGKGSTVPKSVLDKLPSGKYKVIFTETDLTTNETATTEQNFTIQAKAKTVSATRRKTPATGDTSAPDVYMLGTALSGLLILAILKKKK